MIDLCAGGIFSAMFGDGGIEVWWGINRVLHRNRIFCSYSPHRENYWRDKYIGMLKELTGFESVALFSTGAEATEAFWRCCRVYNGKPGVWGGLVDPDEVGSERPLSDAMHGWTLGAMIMGGKLNWPELGVFPELGAGRFGMGNNAVSCMIMEPYHAPSGQFHRIEPTIRRIQGLRKEFPDILFCMDEIQGGFGRTGKLWAYEHYQEDGKFMLSPDFITIGKLCGGGLPLSALLGPKDVMESDSVREFGHLHSTHSGNPLMCAVGCIVIEEMKKQNLIKRSADLGNKMHEELLKLPVRTHGKGLLAGIEMKDNEEVKMVTEKCLRRGVQVCDTGKKWVKIGPALKIEEASLITGISILIEKVEEVVNERKPASCGGGGEGSERSDSHLLSDGVQGNREGDDKGSETSGQQRECL